MEEEYLRLLEEELEYRERTRFLTYFPEEGPLSRHRYAKHTLFFRLGARMNTRAFMAGNRTGKTVAGSFEVTCHLTGQYPAWWDGARFEGPTEWWVAGDTRETTRDILQAALFGLPERLGTGMIPGDSLGAVTWRQGTAKAIDTALVKHVTGGWSRIGTRSYDQGREAFQGTARHGIWLDEEAPEDIRNECVLRLMTTQGHLIETFTPLKGITKVVMLYMGEGAESDVDAGVTVRDGRVMVMAGWDDAPHLSADEKTRMLSETPPHLRDARAKGVPSLGAGAIYPVPESEIVTDPFRVPPHWPAVYGLDVGWKRTAAIWGAHDRDTDTVYLVSEHYRAQAEPVIHSHAIRARGEWIPGVIDPAARGRNQSSGEQMLRLYRDQGLDLAEADNAVEAGLYDVWQRLSTGRLKVFRTCTNWLAEYRVYRRDEKGRIVKENDHLMDATRYLIRSGLKRAKMRTYGAEQPVVVTEVLDPVTGW